ncbi:RNA-directed DNA polymerase, eukaryota, reverse transcriptase zinc-binding domain protein [Tanacetum coccineum]
MAEFTMRRSSTRNSKVPNQYRDFVCSLNSENKGFLVAKENSGVESGESSVNKCTMNENNNGVEIPVKVTVGSSGDRQEDQVDNEIGSKNKVNVTIEDSGCKNNMNGNNKPNSDVTKNAFSYVTSSNAVKFENKLMEIPTKMSVNELIREEGKKIVLDNGPWLVNNKPLVVQEYNYNMCVVKAEPKNLPIWVKMSNVPFEAWTTRGISALASRIVKPLIMDAVTANMCHAGMASKGFARVLIKNENRKVSEQAVNNKGNKSSKVPDGFTEEIVQTDVHSENVINENNMDPKQVHGGSTPKNNNDVTKEQMKGMGPKLNSGGNTPKSKKDAAKKGLIGTRIINREEDIEKDDVFMGQSGMVCFNHPLSMDVRIGIWNVRGMRTSDKQKEVSKFIAEDRLQVCSTLETHLKNKKLVKACEKAFGNWDWVSNMHLSNKGCRIIVGWNMNLVTVRCINMTDQAIIYIIEDVNSHLVSFGSFIYAANRNIDRKKLWEELHRHKKITNGKPWFIRGDMNVILDTNKHSAGVSFINNDMQEFKDCVNMIEVEDLYNSGLFFTWTKNLKNVKKGLDTGVRKKLDRVMANEDFVNYFDKAHVIFKPYLVSDHSQAIVIIPNGMEKKKRAFKFANYIADKDNFLLTVDVEWKKHVGGKVEGLRNEVKSIQSVIDKDPHNKALRESEVVILKDYLIAMEDEEKLIESVQDVNGNRFEGQDVVLFAKEAISMINEVTSKEIKDALFRIRDNRASGPDSYSSLFFKKAWSVVGVDFCKAIKEFFASGKMLKELNSTVISLIPKSQSPLKVTYYRHIACCNVVYKCISKVITGRIKKVLGNLVNINESAFVAGRLQDNILLMNRAVFIDRKSQRSSEGGEGIYGDVGGDEGDDKDFVVIGEVGGVLFYEGEGGDGGRLWLCLQGSRMALWYFYE